MRIGVSVIMAGRSAGGPETYEVQLLRALARIDRENEYIVYVTGSYAISAIGVQQENFRYRILQPSFRPLSQMATLPLWMARDRLDFYHATFTPPPFSATPLVFTVHCLSSIAHPEYYKRFTAMRLNFLLKRGIRAARRILCVSETTRNHVQEVFGIPQEEMRVTYNGVSDRFSVSPDPQATSQKLKAAGIDEPYILYLGKIQKHKNVGRLLEAYRAYRAESKAPLKLVVAGREQGAGEPVDLAISRLGLDAHVHRLGYVPDDLVPELYRGASAFVFPSLWEGFGIPLLEAMASGTPVITSSVTSLPEIAGDAALVIDPHSPAEIASALILLEKDAALRSRLIENGLKRVQRFSWDNCAAATLAAYGDMEQTLRSAPKAFTPGAADSRF